MLSFFKSPSSSKPSTDSSVLLHPTNTRTSSSLNNQSSSSSSSTTPTTSCPPTPTKRPLLPQRPSLLPSRSLSAPTTTQQTQQGTKVQIISAKQYYELYKKEQDKELDLKVLFPWLHGGVETKGSLQAEYFKGWRETPKHIGLTTIHVNSCLSPPPSLTNSHTQHREPTSTFSLYSSSSSSDASSLHSFSSTSTESLPPSPVPTSHSLLVSSFAPSLILTSQNRFNHPKLPTHVDLRRFNIQPAKYASISNLVIYGPDGLTEEVLDLAKRACEAVDYEKRKRVANGVGVGAEEGYQVFVVGDKFDSFEENEEWREIVSVSKRGEIKNRLDWSAREREEMRVLGEESEIMPGVMLGNTFDVPISPAPTKSHPHHYQSSSTSSTTSLSLSSNPYNPQNYAIAVECIDNGRMPDPRTLRLVHERLEEKEGRYRESKDDHKAPVKEGDESFYDAYTGEEEVRVSPDEIVHLECLSTSGNLRTNSEVLAFVNNLVAFGAWLVLQNQVYKRRILLHCGDGYTDHSLLCLTMIMLDRRCSLAEAYLVLQMEKQRSFFVGTVDVELLLQVEERAKVVVDRWEEERLCIQLAQKSTLALEGEGQSGEMERSDSGYLSMDGKDKEKMAMVRGGDEWVDEEKVESMKRTTPLEHPWFFGETWEGAFPSRILEGLYLGNLAHASNALMLKELGITHVVSMGESALTPPRQPPFYATARAHMPTNSLWLENRLGTISVLDMKDVNDDGIDGIRSYFDQALEFIDECVRGGGKVLVHCRVGVSRSATIVIAYLMKHLQLDLASAYLLTRARRLNILIQPNLPFLATLHAFEAELLKEKDGRTKTEREVEEADDGTAGLKWSNRLAWSYISNEIAVLNGRFVQ